MTQYCLSAAERLYTDIEFHMWDNCISVKVCILLTGSGSLPLICAYIDVKKSIGRLNLYKDYKLG